MEDQESQVNFNQPMATEPVQPPRPKLKKPIIIIATIAVLLIAGTVSAYFFRYYDFLKAYCVLGQFSGGTKECCLESVSTMEEYGYKRALMNICPDGYTGPVIADCFGALSFCVPPPKPITSIEDCFGLENKGSFFKPVAYSNIPDEDYNEKVDSVNEETRTVDSCIFNFVDVHEEIVDDSVCNKIVSPYYMYLCRQRIAIHLKDTSLCTEEYLGKFSNTIGCTNGIPPKKSAEECFKVKNVDYCLFQFVYNHEEIMDDSLCDKIINLDTKYWCRRGIAIRLKDISLCSIEYLGTLNNVGDCRHFIDPIKYP